RKPTATVGLLKCPSPPSIPPSYHPSQTTAKCRNNPMKLIVVTMLLGSASLSGCSSLGVQPWERDILTRFDE
ncbi:MAG: hypothetical protein RPT11_07200, partial [Bermanella sp.]